MPKGRGIKRPLVLDTHVWIWLMEGSEGTLAAAAIAEIEAAAADSGVAVAAISVWELAMLEAKGRITLSRSIEEWTRAALTGPGIQLVELSPDIALQSTRLPGRPHGDPADRMIIATARALGGTVVTCDTAILAYGASGHVRTLDGRP